MSILYNCDISPPAIISISKYSSLSGIFGIKSANNLRSVYGVQYASSFSDPLNSFLYKSVTSIFVTLFSLFFDLTTLSKNSVCLSVIGVYSVFKLVASIVNR